MKRTKHETILLTVLLLITASQASAQCTIDSLPYFMDFDSLTPYTTSTAPYDELPPCWHNTSLSASSSYRNLIRDFSGSVCLYVNPQILGNVKYTVSTPLFHVQGATLRISFDYSGRVETGFMTNTTDPSTFLPCQINTYPSIRPNWQRAEFFATLTDSLPVALAFRRIVSTTNNYVDNLSIEIESDCPHPTGVFLDSLETAAAHLSWSSTGAPFYRVITSHDGLDDTLFVYDTTLTVSDLLPTTDYTVRVYSVCSDNDTSLSSLPLIFRTLCGATARMPVNETFDDTTRMPECWTAVTDNAPNVVSNYFYPLIDEHKLRLWKSATDTIDCIAASPLIPTNRMYVSFYAQNTGRTYDAKVGLMTDLSDTSTFIPVLSLPQTISSSTQFEFSTDSLSLSDSLYYVVFRISTGNLYIDNVQIISLSQCRIPEYGTITSTTHHITANWTPTNADHYRVLCTDGTNTSVIITDTSTATFTTLIPTTRYWLNVCAICGSDTTDTLSLGSIPTDCDLYSLPYSNDFESTPNHNYPACWKSVGNTVGETNSVTYDYHNPSNSVFLIRGAYAVSPRFVVPNSGIQVSFQARSWSDYFEDMMGHMLCYTARVIDERVMLDSTMILRFDTNLSQTTFQNYAFNCNEYQTGDTIAIIIHGEHLPHNIMIDNILIENIQDTIWRTVTLTCDSTMGIVSGGGEYIDSSWVTLTATPLATSSNAYHYEFDQWSDGDNDNPRQLFVISDTSLTALFRIVRDTVWRTVTLACDSTMGTVSGGGEYIDSSWVTLTATPLATSSNAYHYEFDQWSDGDTDNPRQIFIISDTAFNAHFRIVQDNVGINYVDNPVINVYPNPSHGMVTITLNQPAVVIITDLHGRIFHQWRLVAPNTSFIVSPDTGLPKGIYFIHASTSSGTSIKKIIIE